MAIGNMEHERHATGRAAWVAPGLAIASLLAYAFASVYCNNRPVEDEMHHLAGVRWYAADGHGQAPGLPMLPGYHRLAALIAARVAPARQLALLRATNTLAAIALVFVARTLLRRLRPGEPGDALLHLVWHPFLFPFLPLVYTEGPALLALNAGFLFQLQRRRTLSGLALLACCLIRHTNVVWVLFLAGWAILDAGNRDRPTLPARECPRRASLRDILGLVWPHLLVVAIVALLLVRGGGLVLGRSENAAIFNPAQFYLFALSIAVLGWPMWAPACVALLRVSIWPTLWRVSLCGYLVALPVLLYREYYNPHIWNRYLDDYKNWCLYGLTESGLLRAAAAVVITLLIPTILSTVRKTTERRRHLVFLWIWSILSLLPYGNADVRYYIVPLILIQMLMPAPPGKARLLTIWYGLLNALLAFSVCRWGDEAGGLW